MDLINKVKTFPETPGVYLMKDSAGKIIYVGKASSLRRRVSSYFSGSAKTKKQTALINNIADIETVLTATEAEALILEAGLIKEYKPKYNAAIKDDKAYPLLKVTLNERFPRLVIVRAKKNDKAVYFGPYTSGKLLREAVAFMSRLFPLRVCRAMPKTACLNYQIKQCLAPCIGQTNEVEYRKVVDDMILFLRDHFQHIFHF